MTKEGSQDAVLIALIASLAVHAVLMFVMRPQVMSRLEFMNGHERRQATKLVVTDAMPPPGAVAMQEVPDIEPLRAAPDAEVVSPGMVSLDSPEDETAPAAPVPDAPDVAELPDPAVEAVPYFSEAIHVERELPDFTVPLALCAAPMPAVAAAAAPVVASAPAVDLVEMPAPDAPELTPHFADAAPADAAAPLLPELPEEKEAGDYVPAQEVLATVDEKLVAGEKEAVRELLDVRDAKELSPVVNLAATSAREGDWLYFRIQINPRADLQPVPKDVVVLLDASGSIGDDRLRSCRSAARSILRSCTNTGDRFNLVAFRDRFSYAFRNWQECDRESFAAADKWLDRLASHGRTDVFASVRSVLTLPRDPKRPLIALVVTDGDANAGVHETSQILSRFSALNDGLISVYMYGVKGSANRELIDVLTHGNRGESFIYEGSRWSAGREIESLSQRFRDPVLTDLRIVYATGTVAEAYPRLLRNLYRGETVDFVGRIPASSTKREIAFSLKGLNGSKAYEGFFTVNLAGIGFDPELPGMWRSEQAVDAKLRSQ